MVFSRLMNTAAIAICAGTVSSAVVPMDLENGESLLEPVMDTIVPERSADERRRMTPGELGRIIDLTPEQKQEFVDQHNDWRNRAALGQLNGGKKARNMPRMYWDEEIAEHAKRYSHTCRWEHSGPVGWNELDYGVGENLYAGWGQSDHISSAMQGWAGEHVGYDHDTTACSIDMCGHYTAVVWEHTTRVGCAMTLCDSVSGLGAGQRYYVICQYYRPGNYRGQQPYTYDTQTGAGCSSSPYGASTGMDTQYPGLCNNADEMCGYDNRCSATQDCTPQTPLNGFFTEYTCGAPRCHYDEFPGYQIKNSWPSVNGMYDSSGNWEYHQNRQSCEDWCYFNKDATPPCLGCTQAYNQPASLWFPVKNIDQDQREQRDHSTGSALLLSVLDCSEPGAAPTNRPTIPPLPTPAPTLSPTLPGNFDCSATSTVSGMEIKWPYSQNNGLTSDGRWKYCYNDLNSCLNWCRANRFTAPCFGVTTNAQNPNFYFPVRTVAEDQRITVSGGSITILECTTTPPTNPTAPPTPTQTNPPTPTPTYRPTTPPTSPPTNPPTNPPTVAETASPTAPPSNPPTVSETAAPTMPPSNPPTVAETAAPTMPPSNPPTVAETAAPTTSPPSNPPTVAETAAPTTAPPSNPPTVAETAAPTNAATAPPTDASGDQYGCYLNTTKNICKRNKACRWASSTCSPHTCDTATKNKNCRSVGCTWNKADKTCSA